MDGSLVLHGFFRDTIESALTRGGFKNPFVSYIDADIYKIFNKKEYQGSLCEKALLVGWVATK